MSKLKQQFVDLKNNTPKHIQWLLLAAAFIVVFILMTLLVSGGKKNELPDIEKVPAELKATPDTIDWSDVIVGQKEKQSITISANMPVKIADVRLHKNANGFTIDETCKRQKVVDNKIGCAINATYAPIKTTATEIMTVFIDWYDANKTAEMTQTSKIIFTLGAVEPVAEPEPIITPEPVIEPELAPAPKQEPKLLPVQDEIKQEIEEIAPPIVFEEQKNKYTPAPEACSDFAFPGYDSYGQQIGWIKPEGGTYKFHPFSDTECDSPTGIYNPDNGIITDINNRGKRIGTDAEHIGYNAIANGTLPELSNAPAIRVATRARQLTTDELKATYQSNMEPSGMGNITLKSAPKADVSYESTGDVVVSSQIHDRQFLLRQYKPIPATIVSDIRADIEALSRGVPVRATVDRNVYSDNGRNVIIPTGTLLLGYVTGEVPGPYKAIGRMNINWYQFILPNGVEFNFKKGLDPYSGDSQGRIGVPGRGSTDYLEQFFMPMLTAFVPAVINLINPVADAFVNQIDLDNNTVVQSGTMRSSELAKNEIITAWNQVAQKLMVDMMDNTVPPFTIAAGTRITVYSPVDLMVTCGSPDDNPGKKCAVAEYSPNKRRKITEDEMDLTPADDDSWVGQSRSFQVESMCSTDKNGLYRAPADCFTTGVTTHNGYSCTTLKLYCESMNYQSKKALQYEAYREDQKAQYDKKVEDLGGVGSQQFNEEIIGVKYDNDGNVENPYASTASDDVAETTEVLTCFDGSMPDANGCCAGEIYTDMGEMGFNCCPETGGDCFPPIEVNVQ